MAGQRDMMTKADSLFVDSVPFLAVYPCWGTLSSSLQVEQRIECQETRKVRYSYLQQQVLSLPVPLDPRVQEEFEQAQKARQEGRHQKAEPTQKRHKKLSEEEAEGEGGGKEEMEKRDTAAEQTASTSQTSESPNSSTLMTTGGSQEHPVRHLASLLLGFHVLPLPSFSLFFPTLDARTGRSR